VARQDAKGDPIVLHGNATSPAAFQHETDHVYGRLYIDRLVQAGPQGRHAPNGEATPKFETVRTTEWPGTRRSAVDRLVLRTVT